MAIRLAIDTNRYRDFASGNPAALDAVRFADEVYLPLVVLAEVRAGILLSAHRNRNERVLQDFLREPNVDVLFPDEATCHFFAQLFVELRQLGKAIPDNDLWIAALVVQHGLTLFTRDRHFEDVPRLPRI